MRIVICAAVAVGITGASAPALAQSSIPSRLNQPPPAQIRGRSALEGMKTAYQFGECTVKRAKGRVIAALDIPVDDPLYNKRLWALATPDCLWEGELQIPTSIMRGTLFEALYRARFAKAGPPSPAAQFDYLRGYGQPLSEDARATLALTAIGDCAVRADPDAAHRMVLNEPGSVYEKAAASSITAKLPGCIAQGQNVRFSRAVIRAAVSEALYRLASAAADHGPAAEASK